MSGYAVLGNVWSRRGGAGEKVSRSRRNRRRAVVAVRRVRGGRRQGRVVGVNDTIRVLSGRPAVAVAVVVVPSVRPSNSQPARQPARQPVNPSTSQPRRIRDDKNRHGVRRSLLYRRVRAGHVRVDGGQQALAVLAGRRWAAAGRPRGAPRPGRPRRRRFRVGGGRSLAVMQLLLLLSLL